MRVGPYEVVSTLGRGGMGVVYAARSAAGEEVAIKVLRRREGDVLARFERERRLLASFSQDDGFVPLLDTGETVDGPYLVMPIVSGGTLREKLAAGPLGIEETIALGRTLASALGRAHARGIVHRDMKPENVLYTDLGVPLVTDLGLAKHFDASEPGGSQSVALSLEGAFRGTAGYMACEQMNDARSVGPASDVFSLGAILYECLAGGPPFVGESIVSVVTKVSEGTFDPVCQRRADVPVWLAQVIERALSKAAEDRFADGIALERALAAGSSGKLRRRGIVIASCLLAAILLALALAANARDRRARALLASGDRKDAQGNFDGAIADFTQATELDPRNALAWFKRGRARGGKEDWQGNIADCTRAIELAPDLGSAWVSRAWAHGRKGDIEEAIADGTKAIALEPELARCWGDRGYARVLKRDYAGAIADYTRAIELGPKKAATYLFNRGVSRAAIGDVDGAIADYTRAVERDPRNAEVWNRLGEQRLKKGEVDATISDCSRAIELDPGIALAWLDRGQARGRKGDLAGSLDDLNRAIELAPTLGLAWSARGWSRCAQGDEDGAIADCTRAVELDPADTYSVGIRAMARDHKGERDAAIEDFKLLLRLAPDDVNAEAARKRLRELGSAER